MINPHHFIDENLKIGFKINLRNHNMIQANSILFIIPIQPDSGNETRYIIKIFKEVATIYARLLNQNKFQNNIFFQLDFLRLMKKIK